ncbi:unnamed protein product, partial [Tenebrio molitor]
RTRRTQGPETHRTQDTFSSRFSFQLLSFSNCLSAFPFSCFPSDITAQENPSRKKKKTQREKETNFFCQCRYLLTYFTLFPSDSNSINSLGLLDSSPFFSSSVDYSVLPTSSLGRSPCLPEHLET